MKFIIWGAGERGKRIFPHIGNENVLAYVDIDISKQGKLFNGKKIISYEEYKRLYLGVFIILSTHESDVIKILEVDGIKSYLKMSDCPEDFQSPFPREYLKEFICNKFVKERKYAVYGRNLFSIKVYEWLAEKQEEMPYFIISNDTDEIIYTLLQQEFGNKVIFSREIKKIIINKIWITEKIENEENLQEYECVKEDITDCSIKMIKYHNKKIEFFKNIHFKERCFIVATGPSLQIEDLNILKKNNEICISMNSIWRAFESTEWRPLYYVADDYRVMRDERQVLNYMKEGFSFIGDTYEPFCNEKHPDNIMIHHASFGEYNDEIYPFSDDFAQICYVCKTVTYSCLQLAVYMGFSEIYLLGVDYSYAKSGESSYGHFHPEEKLTSIGYADEVGKAYLSAQNYTEKNNIKIFNATRGGYLEIFERVDFDSLFKDKAINKNKSTRN